MMARTALILLLFGLLGDTGSEKGRDGNALFKQKQYAAAAAAYRDGLNALSDTTGVVYARLQNNLGLALHRRGRLDSARTAFRRARRAAPSAAARSPISAAAWAALKSTRTRSGSLEAARRARRKAVRAESRRPRR